MVLNIAFAAAHHALNRGIEVMLTRNKDIDVDIDDRYVMANTFGADLFMSIHTNAAGGRGVECLYGKPQYKPLARLAASRLHYVTGWPLRRGDGTWYRPRVGVLRGSRMPAVLTECGFIDYADEAQDMSNPIWIDRVGKAHIDTACNYLGYSPQDGEEEDFMAARLSSPILKEHHFPDVWLEEFGTYWLHVQNRGMNQATVRCYAVLKASDGGSYIDLLGDSPIVLAPDGEAGTYMDFNVGGRIREKTAVNTVTLSVHSDQPIVCVLREK